MSIHMGSSILRGSAGLCGVVRAKNENVYVFSIVFQCTLAETWKKNSWGKWDWPLLQKLYIQSTFDSGWTSHPDPSSPLNCCWVTWQWRQYLTESLASKIGRQCGSQSFCGSTRFQHASNTTVGNPTKATVFPFGGEFGQMESWIEEDPLEDVSLTEWACMSFKMHKHLTGPF